MAELVINIDLDYIEKGIKDLELLTDKIDRAIEDGIQELAEKTMQKLTYYLNLYGLGDSKLAQDIQMVAYDDGIYITVGADYAMFVEYGTGIKGAENPHPYIDNGWQYDVNSHGENGWWYPTTASDPNPYKSVDKETGQIFGWTKGQVSRPFMYMTHKWAKSQATKIIRKHIRGIKI